MRVDEARQRMFMFECVRVQERYLPKKNRSVSPCVPVNKILKQPTCFPSARQRRSASRKNAGDSRVVLPALCKEVTREKACCVAAACTVTADRTTAVGQASAARPSRKAVVLSSRFRLLHAASSSQTSLAGFRQADSF